MIVVRHQSPPPDRHFVFGQQPRQRRRVFDGTASGPERMRRGCVVVPSIRAKCAIVGDEVVPPAQLGVRGNPIPIMPNNERSAAASSRSKRWRGVRSSCPAPAHPRSHGSGPQGALSSPTNGKVAPGDRVPLDVYDAALVPALGAGTIWSVGADPELPMTCKRMQSGMQHTSWLAGSWSRIRISVMALSTGTSRGAPAHARCSGIIRNLV